MTFILTHPDKFLYAKARITKKDLAEYLYSVQHLMIPYIRNRLLSLVRCPDGYPKECFFQKHITEDINGIHKIRISHTTSIEPFFYLKNQTGLVHFAQMDALEIHAWGSHIKTLEKPDVILFDLDPAPSVQWSEVIHLAHFMRQELTKINLISFVKTTGGKGLHIVIPIRPNHSWDTIKEFAKSFAKYIATQQNSICTDSMAQSKRRGKILIDYIRNTRGATAVVPYSLRAHENAPIAMPLHWHELTTKIKPNTYHLKNYKKRLASIYRDPWKNFYITKQSLNI